MNDNKRFRNLKISFENSSRDPSNYLTDRKRFDEVKYFIENGLNNNENPKLILDNNNLKEIFEQAKHLDRNYDDNGSRGSSETRGSTLTSYHLNEKVKNNFVSSIYQIEIVKHDKYLNTPSNSDNKPICEESKRSELNSIGKQNLKKVQREAEYKLYDSINSPITQDLKNLTIKTKYTRGTKGQIANDRQQLNYASVQRVENTSLKPHSFNNKKLFEKLNSQYNVEKKSDNNFTINSSCGTHENNSNHLPFKHHEYPIDDDSKEDRIENPILNFLAQSNSEKVEKVEKRSSQKVHHLKMIEHLQNYDKRKRSSHDEFISGPSTNTIGDEKFAIYDDGYGSESNRTCASSLSNSDFSSSMVNSQNNVFYVNTVGSCDIMSTNQDAGLRKQYSKSLSNLDNLYDEESVENKFHNEEEERLNKSTIHGKLENLLKLKVKSMNDLTKTATLPPKKQQKQQNRFPDPLLESYDKSRTLPNNYMQDHVYNQLYGNQFDGKHSLNFDLDSDVEDDDDSMIAFSNRNKAVATHGTETAHLHQHPTLENTFTTAYSHNGKNLSLKQSMLSELKLTVKERKEKKQQQSSQIFSASKASPHEHSNVDINRYQRRQQTPEVIEYQNAVITKNGNECPVGMIFYNTDYISKNTDFYDTQFINIEKPELTDKETSQITSPSEKIIMEPQMFLPSAQLPSAQLPSAQLPSAQSIRDHQNKQETNYKTNEVNESFSARDDLDGISLYDAFPLPKNFKIASQTLPKKANKNKNYDSNNNNIYGNSINITNSKNVVNNITDTNSYAVYSEEKQLPCGTQESRHSPENLEYDYSAADSFNKKSQLQTFSNIDASFESSKNIQPLDLSLTASELSLIRNQHKLETELFLQSPNDKEYLNEASKSYLIKTTGPLYKAENKNSPKFNKSTNVSMNSFKNKTQIATTAGHRGNFQGDRRSKSLMNLENSYNDDLSNSLNDSVYMNKNGLIVLPSDEKFIQKTQAMTHVGKIDIPKNFQNKDFPERYHLQQRTKQYRTSNSTPASPSKANEGMRFQAIKPRSPHKQPNKVTRSANTSRPTTPKFLTHKLRLLFSPRMKNKQQHEVAADVLLSSDNGDIARRTNMNKARGKETDVEEVFLNDNDYFTDDGDDIDVEFITNQDWLNQERQLQKEIPTKQYDTSAEKHQIKPNKNREKEKRTKVNESRPFIKKSIIPTSRNESIQLKSKHGIGKVVVPDVFSSINPMYERSLRGHKQKLTIKKGSNNNEVYVNNREQPHQASQDVYRKKNIDSKDFYNHYSGRSVYNNILNGKILNGNVQNSTIQNGNVHNSAIQNGSTQRKKMKDQRSSRMQEFTLNYNT